MSRSKYVLILIGIVSLALLAYIGINKSTATKSKVVSIVSSELQAVTMKEAIAIAYEDVRQFSKNAKLVKIISTDTMDNPTSASGESGKRVAWNLMFTDPRSSDEVQGASYNVYVSNGKVASHKKVDFGQHKTISDSDLTLDSSHAVSIAKNQKAIKPGKDWAIGYHFDLEYFPINNEIEKESLIIEVFGLSPKGNFAHVDIDEKTGNIVDAIEKTYDAVGNAIWTDF